MRLSSSLQTIAIVFGYREENKPMTTEKTIKITWRDESHRPVYAITAFRAYVEPDISDTAMKKVYSAYKSAGYVLNSSRQAWVCDTNEDGPTMLVEALGNLGLSVVNNGRVPAELEEEPAAEATAAPSGPRM